MTTDLADLLEESVDDEDVGVDRSAPESRRPALRVLTDDVAELVDELLAGLEDRRALIEWEQRIAVRTFGELPTRFFTLLAREFRVNDGAGMAALVEDVESSGMHPEAAQEVRQRLVAAWIVPAYQRAYRQLRKDAGEYIGGDADDPGHSPARQRYVAMRPALDEIETYQVAALRNCLDGLEDREALVPWTQLLQHATHGEISTSFVERVLSETSTIELLLESSDVAERGRECFAATYLLPAFNSGVRDLSGRTGEEAHAEAEETEVPSL